jgi:CRP/FNR family transcriptional regulator, cyclic AMP receptor protein
MSALMTLEQRYNALTSVPELSAIPAQARATLAAGMRQERFDAGEVVIEIGDQADRVFVLCEGQLEVTQEGRSGPLRRLEPGALLGELAFFADRVRTATVRAVDACVLLSLPYDNFHAFLLRNPESLFALTKRIVLTLRDTELALASRTDTNGREH